MGERIRRRRECMNTDCKKRFTTREEVDRKIMVIKSDDKAKEPFDRNKIIHGISVACSHRSKTVSTDQIIKIAERVERSLLSQSEDEVSSSEIGRLVLKQLQTIDEVAYVRFASVYRRFEKISQFRDELETLTGGAPDDVEIDNEIDAQDDDLGMDNFEDQKEGQTDAKTDESSTTQQGIEKYYPTL